MGCTVQHLHTIGKGCPDILVGIKDINLLVEIKDGNKFPSERKLTTDEKKWFDDSREIMSMHKVHEKFYKDIMKSIRKNRFKKLLKLSEEVKKELKEFEVLHRDKRGLNVVVKPLNDVIGHFAFFGS